VIAHEPTAAANQLERLLNIVLVDGVMAKQGIPVSEEELDRARLVLCVEVLGECVADAQRVEHHPLPEEERRP
jgi:hypothetical protein